MFYIISLTESVLTKHGNRHPSLATAITSKNGELTYISGDFYHAEKEFFKQEVIYRESEKSDYKLIIFKCLGYFKNISARRILSNILFTLKTFIFLMNRVKENDIIFIPSRPVELIYIISLIKRIKKCKIVLDVSDVWPDALVINNKILKYLFKMYCDFYLYKSIKYYDLFLFTSPSYVDWIKRYNGENKKIFSPLGYERKRWKSINEEKKNYPKINFVLVAVLQYQIDVSPFIEAIANDPKYHLTIIGENGNGQRYNEVMDLIKRKNILNVTFTGKIDPPKMSTYLDGMQVGISPIISPLLANKFFDYIGACLPIFNMGNRDMGMLVKKYDFGWSCLNILEEIKTTLKQINSKNINLIKDNIFEKREEFEREHINNDIIKNIYSLD